MERVQVEVPLDLRRRPPALCVCGMCRRPFGPSLRKTKDHVIPRGFFSGPVPKNLPTWNVCEPCQDDLDLADERVRNVFASAYSREPDSVRDLLGRSRRSARTVQPHKLLWLRSELGVMVHAPIAHPPPHDLAKVFTKVVGGLFYWKHHRLAPETVGAVRVVLDPEFTYWTNVVRNMNLPVQHLGNISWVSQSDPELRSGIWLFLVNNGAVCVGVWLGEAATRGDVSPSRSFAVREQ